GSKVSSVLNWKVSDQINLKSNYYYFTDYASVDTEWENTVDFDLGHNFSTQMYVHLIMDDQLKRDPGESLLQVQELLSFGMTYHW
ncbi:MAG: hypothetical protein Q8914_04295, partial [Bacteroidota bacterium]|nr:hypothetical protein [Bacteroidota bacterium]